MIFDLAYQRPSDTQLLSQTYWRQMYKALKLRGNIDKPALTKPFPWTKVSEFLISKQYFLIAARSYASSQSLDIEFGYRTISGRILAAFTREVVAESHACHSWRSHSIQSLKVAVHPLIFECDAEEEEPLPVFERILSAEDFGEQKVIRSLDHIKGIKHFELVTAEHNTRMLTKKQLEVWRTNVKTLENVIRPRIAVGKVDDGAFRLGQSNETSSPVPLYPGSQVMVGSPQEESKESNALGCSRQRIMLDFVISNLTDVSGLPRSEIEKAVYDLIGRGAALERKDVYQTERDMLHEAVTKGRIFMDGKPAGDDETSKTTHPAWEPQLEAYKAGDGIRLLEMVKLESTRSVTQNKSSCGEAMESEAHRTPEWYKSRLRSTMGIRFGHAEGQQLLLTMLLALFTWCLIAAYLE